jgi:hypothetical protein
MPFEFWLLSASIRVYPREVFDAKTRAAPWFRSFETRARPWFSAVAAATGGSLPVRVAATNNRRRLPPAKHSPALRAARETNRGIWVRRGRESFHIWHISPSRLSIGTQPRAAVPQQQQQQQQQQRQRQQRRHPQATALEGGTGTRMTNDQCQMTNRRQQISAVHSVLEIRHSTLDIFPKSSSAFICAKSFRRTNG